MALTPEQIDALPTYTTAQRLKAVRYRLVRIEQEGQRLGTSGRYKENVEYQQLLEQERNLMEQLATEEAGANGGGNVLVKIAGL